METIRLTEDEPSSEDIKPSNSGQICVIMKHFFLLKRRHYVRTLLELICPVFLIAIGIYMLAHIKQFDDNILKNGWIAAPPAMMLTFWFHFYFSLAWLVAEKHDGFRLLMHTMGLRKSSYYLGVSFSMLSISLPISVILGYLFKALCSAKATLSFGIFPLFFLIYPIQLTSIVFALGSLINSPNLVILATLAPLLAAGNEYLFVFTCNHLGANLQFIPMILAHISPVTAMNQMVQRAKLLPDSLNIPDAATCKNYNYPPLVVTFLLMISWSIFMYSFAWYFDSICPWQTLKSPETLLYFLKKKAQRLWHPDQETGGEVPDPFTGYDRKYFEQAPQNKQLGIYIDDVTKRFSRSGTVVDSLSLSVYRGQTTLLLGHNGAGKTTLMNMILGNLAPNQGKLYINGYDIDTCSEQARFGVGVCPQQSILMENLTINEHLDLFASIKCNYSGFVKQRHIDMVLRDVGLWEHRHKLCSQLSGGMKRKLSLALAFVGDSVVLILDEPSSGVDAESRKSLWDSIRTYRSSRTVLLSTQHMEEADYLGDRIAIMSSGRIVCCGSSVFLKKAFGSAYRLRFDCLRESQSLALSKVYQYFPDAKIDGSNNQAATNQNFKYLDTIVELIPSNENSSDDQLIQLFEDLEQNHTSLGIKSFGLKCSTVEDVLLNSAKIFTQNGHPIQSSENIASELEALTDRIALDGSRKQENLGHSPSRTILFESIKRHWIEIYRNLWSNLFWRFILATIVLYSMAMEMKLTADHYISESSSFSFFLLTILMTSFIRGPLTERTSKFKLMQLCSKATHLPYWLSRLIVDFMHVLQYSIIFIICCQSAFPDEKTVPFIRRLELSTFIFVLMLVLCLALLLFAYVLSTCINDMSNGVVIFIILLNMHRVIRFLIIIARLMQLLDYETDKDVIQEITKYLYYVIPTVTAEWTMDNCFTNEKTDLDGHNKGGNLYAHSSFVWLGLIVMLLQSWALAFILAIVERKRVNIIGWLSWQSYFINKRPSGLRDADEDVTSEKLRATDIMENCSERAKNALVAQELTKSYTLKNRAVDGLTFAVGKSECFGLLGPNGAGKSTTFSMLTGDIHADYGDIVCNNLSIENDIDLYCESIGYDPQSNPELSLSPVEALYFMAKLRGIDEKTIDSVVEAFLVVLSMQEHRDKSVASLSGGTKRKLSFAMAVIGSPPVLMLDEPTAGIDPMARRDIWQLLNTLKSRHGSSVIISSHAMEECEAICDRLTIMIQGRMRCIGSFQHLRSKFGQGYIVRIQFDSTFEERNYEEQIKAISKFLSDNLRTLVVTDDVSTNSVVFKISDATKPRSLIFKLLKQLKIVHTNISYLVGDSTLEDIFVSLAKEQREPRDRIRNSIA